jgi:hypothetical protein
MGWLYVDSKMLNIDYYFVFDGEHPEKKKKENEIRKKRKDEFLSQIEQAQGLAGLSKSSNYAESIKKFKADSGFNPNMSIYDTEEHNVPLEQREDYEMIKNAEDNLSKEISTRALVTTDDIENVKVWLK